MPSRPFLARLGLASLEPGSGASLSIAVGTEVTGANRTGFYKDGSTLCVLVNGGDAVGALAIQNTTPAVSPTTGCLQAAGGVGVAGDICIGQGIRVRVGGPDATMGLATTVDGTVVVPTTKVTADSLIFLCIQSDGQTAHAVQVASRVPGVSFTVECSGGSGHDHPVAWILIEPTA